MAEMQEIQSLLTCANDHLHNPILFVLKNKRLPIKQRLQCSECIYQNGGISEAENFNTLQKTIQNRQNELFQSFENVKRDNQGQIGLFKQQIETLRDEVSIKFNSILSKIDDWFENLNQLSNQISKYNLLEELEDFHTTTFETKNSKNIQKIFLCNFQYYEKLKNELETLQFMDRLQKCNSAFNNIFQLDRNFIQRQLQVSQIDEHDTPHLDFVCPIHNKNIIFININKGVLNRLGCTYCDNTNSISVLEFIEQWERYNSNKVEQYVKLQNKQKETLREVIKILERLKYEQFQFYKYITKMIEHKILFGMSQQQLNTDSSMQDVNGMAEELSQSQNIQIKTFFLKERQEIKLELYQKSNDFIKNYQRALQSINEGLAFISTKLIDDKIIQNEECYAISFNNQGTLMAAGYGNSIKVWKFERGALKSPIVLQFHNDIVSCIVYSQKYEWFISGSYDHSIQCWKDMGNNKWGRSSCDVVHQDVVSCLLINKNDDEVISGSWDRQIKIWQYNYKDNILKYQYSLNRHYANIYGISMNETENILVSTSSDQQILIWQKIDQRWQFMQLVNKNIIDFGYRVCFLKGNIFSWQQATLGVTHFFQLQGNDFIQKHNFRIQLNQEVDDDGYFPTIYNKNRNIIIQKHNRYVYILRQELGGQYEIASQPINSVSDLNVGGLTNDGKYLVIWNEVTHQFKIYMINYK